jgi:16S rRNA G966 N2-methylase RsmD
MRVIAGTYRSRILKSLKGLRFVPSDRLRETLFNVLDRYFGALRDLFAGRRNWSAPSRGRLESYSLEKHSPPLRSFERIWIAGIRSDSPASVDVLRGLGRWHPVERAKQNSISFRSAFSGVADYGRVLNSWVPQSSAPGGMVIAEHGRKFALPEKAESLRRFRVLKQGDAALSFYRRGAPAAEESSSAE